MYKTERTKIGIVIEDQLLEEANEVSYSDKC